MRDRTLWTWHIFAGVVILVFLGLHMTIMHLNGTFPAFNNPFGGEPESWQNVAARAKSGSWSSPRTFVCSSALNRVLTTFLFRPVAMASRLAFSL